MKKVFTLLTLLVAMVTSAWAVEGDKFSATCTATSNVSFTKSTTTEITSNATISGGKMYAINGQTSDKDLMAKSGFCMTNNNTYFHVSLNTALAAGDEISITYIGGKKDSNDKGVKVSYDENTSGSPSNIIFTATHGSAESVTYEYTVLAEDGCVGKKDLYVYRAAGATQYFTNIMVTNAASIAKHSVTYSLGLATSGTAPTQADVKEGSSFTVAAAPGDLVPPSGKEFKCWNDGTTDYNAGATYTMGTSNVTLTAVYQDITVKYTITYDLGAATGGTAPTQADLAEGATFEVASAPGDLVPPSGKEFKCWNDGTTDYNAGATYTMGTSNVTLTAVYQDRTYKGMTPTTTLDLSDAANATFTTNWYTENNVIKDCYYDAPNGVVVFSPYAIYQSTQTWKEKSSGNSGETSWDATGVFKGSSYYFSKNSRAVSIRESRIHYYRVTNCTSVAALVGGKVKIDAYEVTAGVVSADPVKSNSIDATGTLTLSDLDKEKEYIIAIYGNNGDSNVNYQEVAFYFPAVSTVSATIAASGYTTFASDNVLDLANLPAGLTAYQVEAPNVSASKITLTQVTEAVVAGTPLVLKGTASTSYDIPVAATGSDISSTNILARGPGAAVSYEAGKTKYVLSGGKFKRIADGKPATVPTNKAYVLYTGGELSAPSLDLEFSEGEATGIDAVEKDQKADGVYYNLAGQRVAQPTKGLYIVNGKKVIIK